MTKKRYQITAQTYDKRGRLISTANNNYSKSHPIQAHFARLAGERERIYLHAEILALLRASDRPIHTIRISNGNGKSAYPCRVCQLAIREWGVQRVIVESLDS